MRCTLYLVRHGIADVASATTNDADRALTPDGARKMARIAAGLKHLGVAPDVVLASPLRRAEQTAELLAAGLTPNVAVQIWRPLALGHSVRDLLRGLHAYGRARTVMLVGHQPELEELAAHLLTGSSSLIPLRFQQGAAAAIEVATIPPRSAGSLLWFLNPKQLRMISRSARPQRDR